MLRRAYISFMLWLIWNLRGRPRRMTSAELRQWWETESKRIWPGP